MVWRRTTGENGVHNVVDDVADGLVQLVELVGREPTYVAVARDGTERTYVGEHVFDGCVLALVFLEMRVDFLKE